MAAVVEEALAAAAVEDLEGEEDEVVPLAVEEEVEVDLEVVADLEEEDEVPLVVLEVEAEVLLVDAVAIVADVEAVEALVLREVPELRLKPTLATRVYSLLEVLKKICWSPRTWCLENLSMARSVFPLTPRSNPTATSPVFQQRSSTVSGILSDQSWLLVSLVD